MTAGPRYVYSLACLHSFRLSAPHTLGADVAARVQQRGLLRRHRCCRAGSAANAGRSAPQLRPAGNGAYIITDYRNHRWPIDKVNTHRSRDRNSLRQERAPRWHRRSCSADDFDDVHPSLLPSSSSQPSSFQRHRVRHGGIIDDTLPSPSSSGPAQSRCRRPGDVGGADVSWSFSSVQSLPSSRSC